MTDPLTMREQLRRIAAPVPPALVSRLAEKGGLSYVSWYDACDLMDERAPGWSHEIRVVGSMPMQRGSREAGYTEVDLAYVVVRVTIPCADGVLSREAVGVDDEPTGQRGTALERAAGSGLRRCFAAYGLARGLYQGQGAKLRAKIIAAEARPQPDHPGGSGSAATEGVRDAGHGPTPLPEDLLPAVDSWHDTIAACDDPARLLGYLVAIDAEPDAYRRAGALRLWRDRLVDIGSPEDLQVAGKAIRKWPPDRASRAELIAALDALCAAVKAYQ